MSSSEEKENNQLGFLPVGMLASALPYILGSAAFIGVGVYAVKAYKDARAKNAAGNIQNDENTKIASQIKSYLGGWFTSAKTDELLTLAKKIVDWKKVVDAYSTLYSGDNLEQVLRDELDDNYEKFIANLSYKGRATNTDGSTIVTPLPIPAGLSAGKSIVYLDSSKYPVTFYKSTADYPMKPYVSYPKGTVMSSKGNLWYQGAKINYFQSSVATTLYLIKLSNGEMVWVNADRNVLKKALKGFQGFDLLQGSLEQNISVKLFAA